MKTKAILLAGAAVLLSNAAQAAELNPYIGMDYVYSHADFKSDKAVWDKALEKDYNSLSFNLGMRPVQYMSLEAFFQQSGDAKGSHVEDAAGHKSRIKSEFYAFGIDGYGYMPIGCDGFNLLGTLGLANYNMKVKAFGGSEDKSRMGYRAGIGMQYDMNEHWAFRVVGRYSYIDSKILDNLMEATAGIRYTF